MKNAGSAVAMMFAFWAIGCDLSQAQQSEPKLFVSVSLPSRFREELNQSRANIDKTLWSDFANAENLGVRDVLIVVRCRQNTADKCMGMNRDVKSIVIDREGDWNPRLVVLSPGEEAIVTSNRDGALYRLALPTRAAPYMKQFGANNDARGFENGSVTKIGPFEETLVPVPFWDAVNVGPTHRSKSGFVFVSAAAMKGVTNDKGECWFAGVGSSAIEVRLWHELVGWVDEVSLGDGIIRLDEEWITPTSDGGSQRLALQLMSLNRRQKH